MADRTAAKNPRARKSGIVIPRKLKWHHYVLAWLIQAGAKLISWTWRCTFVDPHRIYDSGRGPMIFCLWHNRLALSMKAWEHWRKEKTPTAGLVALISASHDGGLLARVLRYFDVQPVRGSSSRRGAQAMLELTTYIQRGYHVAITPDGPRGPCYVVQDGVISLAQISGRPIIPVSVHIRGKLTMKSWDRFQIPLLFARCELRHGELLHVPSDASESQREELKRELQRRLMALTTD
ncbi:MAG TPA: lysophospholipid acyltransferase family protein [Candidatus Acidoferrum sp.]|nr:lysophospholipid acyltransferase family protein [Candidatus Acidoferrum sp.]